MHGSRLGPLTPRPLRLQTTGVSHGAVRGSALSCVRCNCKQLASAKVQCAARPSHSTLRSAAAPARGGKSPRRKKRSASSPALVGAPGQRRRMRTKALTAHAPQPWQYTTNCSSASLCEGCGPLAAASGLPGQGCRHQRRLERGPFGTKAKHRVQRACPDAKTATRCCVARSQATSLGGAPLRGLVTLAGSTGRAATWARMAAALRSSTPPRRPRTNGVDDGNPERLSLLLAALCGLCSVECSRQHIGADIVCLSCSRNGKPSQSPNGHSGLPKSVGDSDRNANVVHASVCTQVAEMVHHRQLSTS